MILYHTGSGEIRDPGIQHGRKNADFGQGFYLTPDREFACRWARDRKDEQTVLNIYELDTEGLDITCFTRTEDWFRYIFGNRNGRTDTISSDVVIGPIAYDTIYDTLGVITSGFLSSEDALQLLLIGPEYTQTVIKTEKAANHLKWISAEILTSDQIREYRRIVAAEEKEYQEKFAEKLDELIGNGDVTISIKTEYSE